MNLYNVGFQSELHQSSSKMMLKTSVACLVATLVVFGEISAQGVRDTVSNCVVYENTNIKTYDGSLYSFNSNCGFTLLALTANNLVVNRLNDPSRLQIIYRGVTYEITVSDAAIASHTINGVANTFPSTYKGVSITKPGRMVIAEIPALGIKIRFDRFKTEVIQDNVDNNLLAKGMCGNNDGISNNDLVLPNGDTTTVPLVWADSWALNSCTSSNFVNACGTNVRQRAQAQAYCNYLFSQSQFTGCTAYSSIFLNVCISNYCSCVLNRDECLCRTLDAYVRTCEKKTNSVITWRNATFCPMQCANPDKAFAACAPNHREVSCGQDPITNPLLYDCEEGCYCPGNMYNHDGECLFLNECPCRYSGAEYPPGAVIPKDCNTCTCTNGKFTCTKKCCCHIGSCIGDPHYHTFDGKRYDYMGKCRYYMVRGINFDVICDHYVRGASGFIKNFQSTAPSFCIRVIVRAEGHVIGMSYGQIIRFNGRLVQSFPFKQDGISITRPTSQHTMVTLRNKAVIYFDGVWHVQVRVPNSMTGRLKGLLGTLSGTPTDDFTKPDGTVVTNANVFGDSWVVPGSCASARLLAGATVLTETPHPCDVSPDKRPAAEQACAAINSTLFAGCSDDPATDYADCVYDGCLCPDGDTTCLCGLYEGVARQCIAKGIQVDWRATVTECALTCPAGQTYQSCGNSCTRSCGDISDNPECVSECVDGCNCPPGYTLNSKGQCIPIAQCTCPYNGAQFPAGYTFVDIDENQKLVCENALWTVSEARRPDIVQNPSLDDFLAQCAASQYLTFAGCKRTNTLTCANVHLQELPDYDNCVSGCECTDGLVLDTDLGLCVLPQDCPCIYQGISHQEGAVIDKRDEKCTCVSGLWECVAQTDYWAMCFATNNLHIRTFDQTIYSFEGYCEYVLFEYTFGTGVFRVTLETSSCNVGSCIAAVYVHHRAADGLVENVVFIIGQDFVAPPNLQNLVISDLVLSTLVDVVGLGIRVVVNENGWVQIHASQVWRTWVSSGLCGIYDNDPSNDLQVPGQVINGVADFVNYNRLDNACGGATELIATEAIIPTDPCNYLLDAVFSICHNFVPVDNYLEVCLMNALQQLNLPASQRTNYYCEIVGAYAQECNEVGVHVNWRTAEICPFQCPANTVYNSCDTPCPKENCANTVGYNCQDKVCVEACTSPACPEGTIYEDATNTVCIPPSQCPVILRSLKESGAK